MEVFNNKYQVSTFSLAFVFFVKQSFSCFLVSINCLIKLKMYHSVYIIILQNHLVRNNNLKIFFFVYFSYTSELKINFIGIFTLWVSPI